MATNVLMPKWGMTMEQGQVNCWLKKVGDQVEQGEALVEVESSKATEFVEAPTAGVLASILVPEGASVPITTVLAIITAPGESISEPWGRFPNLPLPPAGLETCPTKTAGPAQERRREGRRVAASPAARRLARERRLDLAGLTGTGPDGMIVVEDVEAALKAPPLPDAVPTPPPSEAKVRVVGISRVAFFSQQHKLDGILYLPPHPNPSPPRGEGQVAHPNPSPLGGEGLGVRGPLPGVVFCLGFTYLKELLVPEMAKRLSAGGYACLIFDYRGFGKSEGPRGRLLPLEQVADIQAAVTFLATRPEVAAGRIGLVGISLGGSHALYVASMNERVRSVAALAPVGDGCRWLRSSRRSWEWVEFLKKIEADRTARVLGGQGERVDAWDIVAPDPASRAFLEMALREFPPLKCELSLETAEALIAYRPETMVGRISPRPLLLLHGESDMLVPADESRSLFAQAGEPRELVLMPGMGHFDWTQPQEECFDRVMDIVSRWLGRHLAGVA